MKIQSMMKIAALAILFAGAFWTGAQAQGSKHEMVVIKQPLAFATAEGQKNGAVFFELQNHEETAIRLVSVSADVSESAELHTMTMNGDTMEMRKAEQGFEIPSHGNLKFTATGDHVMLIGLKAPLAHGTKFPVTLNFEGGKVVTALVSVITPGGAAEAADKAKEDDAHSHH